MLFLKLTADKVIYKSAIFLNYLIYFIYLFFLEFGIFVQFTSKFLLQKVNFHSLRFTLILFLLLFVEV